jgi:hypothetical protein
LITMGTGEIAAVCNMPLEPKRFHSLLIA